MLWHFPPHFHLLAPFFERCSSGAHGRNPSDNVEERNLVKKFKPLPSHYKVVYLKYIQFPKCFQVRTFNCLSSGFHINEFYIFTFTKKKNGNDLWNSDFVVSILPFSKCILVLLFAWKIYKLNTLTLQVTLNLSLQRNL